MKYLLDVIILIILVSFLGVVGAIALILTGWGLLIFFKYRTAKV
jgi:hypothetical protein